MDMEDAIYDLVPPIRKQIEQQEEANGIMRGLVDALRVLRRKPWNYESSLKSRVRHLNARCIPAVHSAPVSVYSCVLGPIRRSNRNL